MKKLITMVLISLVILSLNASATQTDLECTVDEKTMLPNDCTHSEGQEMQTVVLEVYEPDFTYTDLNNHWAWFSAASLAERDAIVGEMIRGEYHFYPDKEMSRLDFLLFVFAVLDIKDDPITTVTFEDEQDLPEYVVTKMKTGAKNNIIQGITDENGKKYLKPYEPVTRAQAVTMLNAAINPETNSSLDSLDEFTDLDQVPEFARQAFANLKGYGIVKGYEDKKLRANNKILKAEAGEIAFQALKYADAHINAAPTLLEPMVTVETQNISQTPPSEDEKQDKSWLDKFKEFIGM